MMDYLTLDFTQVRRLVLDYELEPDPHTRLDDSVRFRASDQLHRAMLAICSLRERAMVVVERLSLASRSEDKLLQQVEEEGSIWFDEAIFTELLSMIPLTVACCPDLLFPETLLHSVLTTRNAGSLLKACLVYIPLLKKECIELLVDFTSTCSKLGQVGAYQPSDPFLLHCFEQSYHVMNSLYQSDSRIASILREMLLQRCICATMIIYITVEVLKDVLDFTSRILFSDEQIHQWIILSIRSRDKATKICLPSLDVEKFRNTHWFNSLHIKEATVLELQEALHISAESAFLESGWTSHLCCHLKVYCVLVNVGGLQPIHEEVVFWLRALRSMLESPGDTMAGLAYKCPTSKRGYELGVAFFFLVPGFHSSPPIQNLFRECILSFLGPAVSNLVPFEGEIALWLVIQLMFRGYAQVSEFCSKAIGINVKIDSTCWEDISRVAYETGIISNIKSITTAASSLRATGPISSTKFNRFHLDSLFLLLQSGHFVRSGVDITDSIMQCILLSMEPIHPIVVQIIEMFVKASCTPAGMNSEACVMQPLPYSFLASAIKPFCSFLDILESLPREETGGNFFFSGTINRVSFSSSSMEAESTAQAVLASYYILYREQFQQSLGTCSGNYDNNLNSRRDEISWLMLLRYLPLDKLHAHLESHLTLYEQIFPQWAGLAFSLFPEKMHVSHLIQRIERPERDFTTTQKFSAVVERVGVHDEGPWDVLQNNVKEKEYNHFGENFSLDRAHQVFRNSLVNCIPALELLKATCRIQIPARDKLELHMAIIEDMLPLLLDKSCSATLQLVFCQWWYSLDQASVEFLVPYFCRCISTSYMDIDDHSTSINGAGLLSASSLYQELVEQPLSILACRKEIYQIPLLSIFLDVLRGLLVANRHMCFLASPNNSEPKREEIMKVVDTRDSAVCQVLLENWSRMLSVGVDADLVDRAGSLICGFLASLFELHPSILRVVHYQGYDMKLVPAIVKGVTMMVHFLEFFEDCMKLIDLPKLPFMIVLLSNIIRRFPNHSRSLSAARKVLMHIKSFDLETIVNSLEETLEHVVWFSFIFPLLQPEVRDFLEGCLSGMPSGKVSSGPNTKRFHSSALSALALVNKDGGYGT